MSSQTPDKFNIRVYGICIQDGHILLVDECMNGFEFTKFPGGGLELGEGLADGLRREFREELGVEAGIMQHVYTTDFFQSSAFRPNEQLISVYYEVELRSVPSEMVFPYRSVQPGNHELTFYWVPVSGFRSDMLTFPIDKHLYGILKNKAIF